MQRWTCANCGQTVYVHNTQCLRCGHELGYDPRRAGMVTLRADGDVLVAVGEGSAAWYRRCARMWLSACNWLVAGDALGADCDSCRMVSRWPNSTDERMRGRLLDVETARRRLLHQAIVEGLDLTARVDDPSRGLAFELLSSEEEPVTIGHADGVITIDVEEADDVRRARLREQFGEAYRTVLGTLRHEGGHHWWRHLVLWPGRTDAFRAVFGDERLDYGEALEAHYAASPKTGWEDTHVSAYATAHPWEDWAETFAHWLHIRDALQTSAAYRLDGQTSADMDATLRHGSFEEVLAAWLPLVEALNAMNRSIGRDDFYPFTLAPAVVDKLAWVHDVITGRGW